MKWLAAVAALVIVGGLVGLDAYEGSRVNDLRSDVAKASRVANAADGHVSSLDGQVQALATAPTAPPDPEVQDLLGRVIILEGQVRALRSVPAPSQGVTAFQVDQAVGVAKDCVNRLIRALESNESFLPRCQ